MTTAFTKQIATALAQFSSTTRLYELTIGDGSVDLGSDGLLVEAFAADDAVNYIGARDVIVLSTSAHVEMGTLLGQVASLRMSLADGTRTSFAGDISEIAMLGSDGGFSRYRVCISPWLWRLGQVRNSRVWQDKSVIEIVDSVFDGYQPLAKWRWSDEARPFMDGAIPRSYCCQYRESDLEFVRRLLADEGLSWRIEQTKDGPGVVLFADSTQPSAVPEDRTSQVEGGIRYHGVSSVERQDTVQALIAQRRLHASLITVLSYDYKSRQIVAAGSPSRIQSGRNLPALESYDVPGQYAYADRDQAQRYAELQMESKEARSKRAPLNAMVTSVSGMVDKNNLEAAQGDARARNTAAGDGKLPHTSDPIIAITAKDGFGANAGQSIQLANGETVTVISGQDTQFVTGGQMRVHTGQAIGVLAGAVAAGESGIGLQLIAAKDAIDIQAQTDELKVQARDEVKVISASAHIDWAAAKRVSLSTAGGANITIEGGNITVQCPGKIMVHAGKKSLTGPSNLTYPLPALPTSICVECLMKARGAGSPFVMRSA